MSDLFGKKWLIFDADNIAWAAFHSTKARPFSLNRQIIYQFLNSVVFQQSRNNNFSCVFCWDNGKTLREKLLKTYKWKRRHPELDPKEITIRNMARQQMNELRDTILPELGYNNVFSCKGFEADDLIASVCHGLGDKDSALVLSSDKDLYQLLKHNVSISNGNGLFTEDDFVNKYGIFPKRWWRVKAIGGCTSDQVRGVHRIGEGRALQYLKGELKQNGLCVKRIEKELEEILERNKKIVKLPFKGTPKFKLREDTLSRASWNRVMDRYQIRRLRARFPGESHVNEDKAKEAD